MTLHPCVACGACCASFRVAFYWIESESNSEYRVPSNLVEDLDLRQRCMKGTNSKHHPKCIALKGKVGKQAYCSIYENRPTPCRAFSASYEAGVHQPRCDEARAKHGLPPLSREDWQKFRSIKNSSSGFQVET